MDLTISIVTHRNRELLRECLASVFADLAGAGVAAEVYVVVNVPGDGSADMAREKFPQATVLENDRPLGFGANHNQVIRRARGRHVFVLNDDTTLHPGCIAALRDFLDSAPDAGAAGPRVLNLDGTLQQSCYRLPTLGVLFFDAVFLSSLFPAHPIIGGYKRWPHDTRRAVGHVIGAAVMFSGAALERAGLFDENYFLYYEEADLCKRLARAGYGTYLAPEAVVTHHGGATISQLGAEGVDYFYTSMHRYYAKYFGRPALLAVTACNVFGALGRLALFGAAAAFSPAYRRRSSAKRDSFRQVLAWYGGAIFGRSGGKFHL